MSLRSRGNDSESRPSPFISSRPLSVEYRLRDTANNQSDNVTGLLGNPSTRRVTETFLYINVG
jgi:hypothetical protein